MSNTFDNETKSNLEKEIVGTNRHRTTQLSKPSEAKHDPPAPSLKQRLIQ